MSDVDVDPRWIWNVARRNPEVVFRRLLEHDALHLQERVRRRLGDRYLLLDAERVFRRAAARVAYRAATEPSPRAGELDGWFRARLDEAADDCLAADVRALEAGREAAEDLEHYAHFHWTFMVPLERTLAASVAFHGCSEMARRSFFELLIERRPVEECLERGLGPPERLREHVHEALDAATGIASGESADEEPAVEREPRSSGS